MCKTCRGMGAWRSNDAREWTVCPECRGAGITDWDAIPAGTPDGWEASLCEAIVDDPVFAIELLDAWATGDASRLTTV